MEKKNSVDEKDICLGVFMMFNSMLTELLDFVRSYKVRETC